MKKPQFETGNVGLGFVDENKAANKDTELPEMVNAKVSGASRVKTAQNEQEA